MVLLPPAPQAGASASSATSAWPCVLEGGPAKAGHYVPLFCRRRWRRRRRCGCGRRRGLRRGSWSLRAAHDRARSALPEQRQRQREKHEEHSRNRCGFRQQRRARSRAECRLAAAAAEGARDVSTATLLQEDHQRQHQADQNVKSDDGVVHKTLTAYCELFTVDSVQRTTNYTPPGRLLTMMS